MCQVDATADAADRPQPAGPRPYSTGHAKIDPAKPLVPQVGQLGPAYDAWTHQALPGIPRLFGPDWMEACSKTPWWIIPAVWLPLSSAAMAVAVSTFAVSGIGLAWRLMVGFALWHFIEYMLHRFAFHYVPTSHWGITFHFLLHGIHHKYPNDALRLVMPLVPAAGLTAFLVTVFKPLFPWREMFPLATGVILGYVQYDCTHYFMHHGVFKGHPWFEPLRESHMDHHFRDHSHGYGITTPFFDFCFSTWNGVQAAWGRGVATALPAAVRA